MKFKKLKLCKNIWLHELQCRCCGKHYDTPCIVAYELQQIINGVSDKYGIARISVKITSATRCYNHNKTVSNYPDTSKHLPFTEGDGVDFKLYDKNRRVFIKPTLVTSVVNKLFPDSKGFKAYSTFCHFDTRKGYWRG